MLLVLLQVLRTQCIDNDLMHVVVLVTQALACIDTSTLVWLILGTNAQGDANSCEKSMLGYVSRFGFSPCLLSLEPCTKTSEGSMSMSYLITIESARVKP